MKRRLDYSRIHGREGHKAFVAEAKRQGHKYVLYVENGHIPKEADGHHFVSPSEAKAIDTAHYMAWFWGNRPGSSDFFERPRFPTNPYKLYHVESGRLIREYTPPTLEEVGVGKVELANFD
jgi:hypothetical protein